MMAPRGGASSIIGAGTLLLLLLFAGFALRDGALFNRALELDEWHTLLVVRQSAVSDVLRALSQGADFNPPLLHLWYWLLGSLGGGITPLQLRLTAFVSIWLALVGLFVLLRRETGWLPALIGSLLVLASTEVLHHAFEARFYGPWLLLTVLHVGTVARACEQPNSLSRQIAACISAALLCVIHYFGVITLVLISLGALIASRGQQRARAIVPSVLAGIVALAGVFPLLVQQRNALSIPTWVWPPTVWSATLFAVPAILLLAVGGWALRPFPTVRLQSPDGISIQRPVMSALWLLALLPLILVVFSLTVQSVLLPRYALPAMLSIAPVSAAISARLRRSFQFAIVGLAVVAAGVAAIQEANRAAAFRQRVESDRASIREVISSGSAIAVASPTVLYPLLDLPANSLVLGMAIAPPSAIRHRFPESSDSAALGRAMIVVQELAAIDRRLFGIPGIVTVDSLARLPCFYLLELWDAPGFAQRWLPDREALRVKQHLFVVRRKTVTANSAFQPSCS